MRVERLPRSPIRYGEDMSVSTAKWPGAVNAWTVRPGLWRMGRAEYVDNEGWRAALDDGVRTVVDLRLPAEVGRRDTDPDAHIPGTLRRISAVVEDPEHPEYRDIFSPYMNHPSQYEDLLRLFPEKVAAAVRAVRDAWADGGVVVHCSAGRDRTGLILALLLQLDAIPGGPASREEQLASYEAAVRGMNHHWLTSGHTHPHERYLEPEEFEPRVAGRIAALNAFLDDWPAERVACFLGETVEK